jgi:hypothetical protein
MFTRTRITGIVLGLITLAAVVVTGLVVAMPAITRWGATDAEVAMSLPGNAARACVRETGNCLICKRKVQLT